MPPPDPEYGVAFEFIDTGMGDCTLVQVSPWNRGPLLLIDFGEKWSKFRNPAARATQFLIGRISEVCRNRGDPVPRLDYLFVTHGDADHWNKLDWLIDGTTNNGTEAKEDLWKELGAWPPGTKLKVGLFTFGGRWPQDYKNKRIVKALTGAVETYSNLASNQHNVLRPDNTVSPQWTFADGAGGVTNVYLLSSNVPNKAAKDPNPKSLVIMFEYVAPAQSPKKVILTGDAESAIAEPQLLKNYPPAKTNFLESLALKLGHHASEGSSSDEWLAAVKPEIVFASGDYKWGHPYCAPFARAEEYLGSQPDEHWYACSGTEGGDYRNNHTELQACSNLWYVVTGASQALRMGAATKIEPRGWYGGVQWRLQLKPDGTFSLTNTPQWSPP